MSSRRWSVSKVPRDKLCKNTEKLFFLMYYIYMQSATTRKHYLGLNPFPRKAVILSRRKVSVCRSGTVVLTCFLTKQLSAVGGKCCILRS